MQTILVIAAVQVLVAAVPVYRGFTAGRPARVAEWAARHGLPLGDDNAAVVGRYLRRSRRWRATGALGGLLTGTAVVSVTQANGLLTFVFLLVGYLGGVTLGELASARPVQGTRRRARLAPRDLVDHVPPATLRWMNLAVAAMAAGTLAFFVLPRARSYVDPLHVGLAAAWALGFHAASLTLARRLVQRSQPASDEVALVTDDALRASGVRAVLAASAAMTLLALSFLFGALATTDVQVLRWTMWLPATGVMVLAFPAWQAITDAGARRGTGSAASRPRA